MRLKYPFGQSFTSLTRRNRAVTAWQGGHRTIDYYASQEDAGMSTLLMMYTVAFAV
jgi:hypothetical protein